MCHSKWLNGLWMWGPWMPLEVYQINCWCTDRAHNTFLFRLFCLFTLDVFFSILCFFFFFFFFQFVRLSILTAHSILVYSQPYILFFLFFSFTVSYKCPFQFTAKYFTFFLIMVCAICDRLANDNDRRVRVWTFSISNRLHDTILVKLEAWTRSMSTNQFDVMLQLWRLL